MEYRIILLYCCMFYLGAMLGSFYDLLGYRIMGHHKLIASSTCDKCGKEIKWIYLVPIFGYIFSRGRCRHCKKTINPAHPIIEVVTACLFITNLYLFRTGFITLEKMTIGFGLISYLVILTSSDIYHKELPDSISFIFFMLAIFSPMDIKDKLLGFTIGFIVLYSITYIGYKVASVHMIGGGDIKVFSVIGIILGPINVMVCLFLAAFLGLFASSFVKKDKGFIPFVPFILISGMFIFYYGDMLVKMYVNLFLGA